MCFLGIEQEEKTFSSLCRLTYVCPAEFFFLFFINKRLINRNKYYNDLKRRTCCIKSLSCMLIGICIDDNYKS